MFQRGAGVGYLPFALMSDASLREDVLGRTVLDLRGTDGETLSVRLNDPDPIDLHREIVRAVLDWTRSAKPPITALARGDRPIARWLEDLDRVAPGGYRDAAIGATELGAIMRDARAHGDVRAAAAYLILSSNDSGAIRDLIEVLVEHAVPPIVLVMVRVAPGGASLVDDEFFAEVCSLLPSGDAPPARAATASPAVSGALAAVREARAAMEVTANDTRTRRGPRSAAIAESGLRWVGRSWAL